MKHFALLALLLSQNALAYGPRFATGQGFRCITHVESRTIDRTHCAAHVKSETAPEPIRRDGYGHRYTSVFQTIDNADCFETSLYANYPIISGDTSGRLTSDLQPTFLNPSTSVKYNNGDGVIDTETRHGVIYYITKVADATAAARDQAALLANVQRTYRSILVTYDPVAFTLTFDIDGAGGARQLVQPANFAKGTSSRAPGFTASLKEPLAIGSYTRTATFELDCSALTP